MNKTTLLLILAVTAPTVHHAAWADDNGHLDGKVRQAIRSNGLQGDPAHGREIPSIHSAKAQLGMRLFFNKALGGMKDTACVSCHHPLLGGSDDLSLPIGTGAAVPDLLGPGRTRPDGIIGVPRNSPTTFNTALWDSVLFWDGRIERTGAGIRTPSTALGIADPNAGDNLVSAQAKFPVTSAEEMRGTFASMGDNPYVWDHLRGRVGNFAEGTGELAQSSYWVTQFQQVYGTPTSRPEEVVTTHNLFDAIGNYERSQVFVNNPWQRYVQGDARAINDSAKRGALLFYRPYNQGGANCVACHAGDRFTDEKFYALAAPQLGRGGRGGADNSHDYGRGNETKLPEDRFNFRTPSLLNVEGTAPYTHAGAYLKLEDVVRHHLDPAQAVARYDVSKVVALNPGIDTHNTVANTQEALQKLQGDIASNRTPLRPTKLRDQEVDDLVAFLRTLTDPCIKSATCLADWMPPLAEDPNGLQLDAQFNLSKRAKAGDRLQGKLLQNMFRTHP